MSVLSVDKLEKIMTKIKYKKINSNEMFVKEIAENRGLSVVEVVKLADGSSMPGALGDQETARAWFTERLGIFAEEIELCE